jgi:hypothetical protein
MYLEEEGPVWTANLHFNNSWKYSTETNLLFIYCVKAFD